MEIVGGYTVDKYTYITYIKEHLRNFLDIDIKTINNTESPYSEVGFYLDYLDDHLLDSESDSLSVLEKKELLFEYMNNLSVAEKNSYMEIHLQLVDSSWDCVRWEVIEVGVGILYLYLYM
jgi:hypothetical protein